MNRIARPVVGLSTWLLLAGSLAFAQPGNRDESPLLREPETPEAALKATMLMLDIGRPKLARRYLATFDALMPDDDTLLDLREKYGPDTFLRLSNTKELQPQSIRLLERVAAAFQKRAQDPARVDALIAGLAGPPAQQATSIVSIRDGGANVVPRLLQAANDPRLAGHRDALVLALTKIGSEAAAPLEAGLQATDPAQLTLAIEGIGWIGSKENLVDLWYPATASGQPPAVREAARAAIRRVLGRDVGDQQPISTDGAVRTLIDRARREFALEERPTAGTTADVWTWSAARREVSRTTVDSELAALNRAVRYSWQAVRLAPESSEAQALHVAARGAYDLKRNGWSKGLPTGPGTAHDLAASVGPQVVSQALQVSLDAGNSLGSMAMLTVLGRIGRTDDLYARGESRSPVVTALNDADPRVRFAAANAVLSMDPKRPFPSSTRVVEILVRTLTDDGQGSVALVDPNVTRGRTMASLFAELGFDVASANTGQGGFRIASSRGDVELVALQANVARWGLTQTIANLRADARTKALPIVVYNDPEFPTSGVERLRKRYQPIEFVDFGIREERVLDAIRPFVKAHQSPITPEERVQLVEAALYWLTQIADGRRTDVYDISSAENSLFALATDPGLSADAILVLGAIPRGSSQQRLFELAVNSNNGTEIQRQAAEELNTHIQRFGLLLSGDESMQVVRLWESAPEPPLASALAKVVGTMKPNGQLVSDRISEVPPAPLP